MSLVSMLVTQGICFFSCITWSPGTLLWKSKATFLLTLVRMERRSVVLPSLWSTCTRACTNHEPAVVFLQL